MTQKEALAILKTGRNVFLTGAAGSGKTFVLREYIKYLNGLNAEVGITASTGIAATHMGGVTIHSWSGVGIKDDLERDEILAIADRHRLGSKIKNTSVLIIDEISMLHHFRLDLIDKVLRTVRENSQPFGGVQLVLCGDFFQLPPVHRASEREAHFAYYSESWKNSDLKICYLLEQHRQNDQTYTEILNAIRENNISEELVELLQRRFNQNLEGGATKLYSHNQNVETENESELKKLSGQTFEYEMQTRGRKNLVETLKKSCLAPETLRLKLGAKVMFIKNNFEAGYVNGTLGTVADLGTERIKVRTLSGSLIEVERASWQIEEEGRVLAELSQYPLRLAWAITVHKSQGMSLDAAEIDLGRSFERGMGYVALSRVRSLSGLHLTGLNALALKVSDEVLDFDKKLRELSRTSAFHARTLGEQFKKLHTEFAERVRNDKRERSRKRRDEPKLSTVEETKRLLEEGLKPKKIAEKRNLKLGTILEHLEEIKQNDPSYNLYHLRNELSKNKFNDIYRAFQKVGLAEGGKRPLSPVKELLGPKYSFDDLRLVRLFL